MYILKLKGKELKKEKEYKKIKKINNSIEIY
jgi:hypothetical protein